MREPVLHFRILYRLDLADIAFVIKIFAKLVGYIRKIVFSVCLLCFQSQRGRSR